MKTRVIIILTCFFITILTIPPEEFFAIITIKNLVFFAIFENMLFFYKKGVEFFCNEDINK